MIEFGRRSALAAVGILFLALSTAFSMPPHQGVTLTQFQIEERARLGVDAPKYEVRDQGKEGIINGPGHVVPLVTGTKRFPVVAIEFTDYAHTYTVANFSDMLFGTWTSGSARDYYHQVSYNQFHLTGDVDGWYTSVNAKAYYGVGNGDYRAAELVKEAAAASDATVDYSLYDYDANGYVSVFTCLHAGYGAEESGSGSDIWSHMWDLNSAGVGEYVTDDPWPGHPGLFIKINTYTIDPERSSYTNYGTMACIGVFCHEWGHALGLPDLYNTAGGAGEGLGNFSLMAGGSWGGNGGSPYYPVHLDPWCKMELGWLNPAAVRLRNTHSLPQVENNDRAYWLISNARTFKEYWLVENREKTLFDQNLYNSGLYIYHIDDSVIARRRGTNSINANSGGWKYGVALEQADGNDDLFAGTNRGDANDAWPGGLNRVLFDNTTTPNSKTNYPSSGPLASGCLAKNIPASGNPMVCSLASGVQGEFTGGPDGSGYSWIDSDTTGGPTFAWNNITGTGTLLGNGDDARWQVTLPYNFSFYGTSYNTINVCTNGWLSFGSDPGTNAPTNTTIPSAGAPNAAVFAFWDDLNLLSADSGYVYYQNFGTSPNCSTVVMWKNARCKGASTTYLVNQVTFEVVLYENGKIHLRYHDCAVSDTNYSWGRSASIGIENSGGAVGLQYACNGTPVGNLLQNVREIEFVQAPITDVQTVSIDVPTGTVNQGAAIAPKATVRNNGNASQTFNVTFTISGGYSNTQSVTLGAGAQQQVTFSNWTAGPLGSLTTRCTTALSGDQVPGNDVQAGSVFVQSLDAQTVSIDVPTGTVNQGAAIAPKATIRNNGNTSRTFNVVFTITGGYSNTQSVTLGAGAQQQVTFSNWTAGPAGTQTTKCTTQLAGDMTPGNDVQSGSVFVQSLDAQTVSIDAPTGTVDMGAVIAPMATVRNNGNTSQTFNVVFTITGGYTDTKSVTLGAGVSQQVTFVNWTAGPAGTQTTKCTTQLAGDITPGNDKLTGTVMVQTLDAQTVSIDVPTGTVNQGAVVTPKATVRNNGNTSQTFNVVFTITGGYTNTQSVTLGAGAQQQVTFSSWTAGPLGSQTTRCTTALSGDQDPSNDVQTGSVFVQSLDAQTVSIDAPAGTVSMGAVIAPMATVHNNGNTSQTFNVVFTITGGYTNTQSVTLGAGAQQQVTFSSWTAGPAGTQTTKCTTQLAGDMTPSNDKLTGTVIVQALDAQTVSIDVPTGTVNQGAAIAPKATVRNNGTASQTFNVTFTISGGYTNTQSVTLGAGAQQQVTFSSWTAGPLGSQTTRCTTALSGDQDPSNDVQTGSVFVQSLDAQTVSIDAPTGTVDQGTLVAPLATVRNNGNNSKTFDVTFTITGGYSSTQSVTLGAGASQQVMFAGWTAGPLGTQTTKCTTQLTGDMTPGNDALTGTVIVQVMPAPGAFELIAPANHATGIATSGTMTWEASAGAASYEVFYDEFTPPTTPRGSVTSPSYDYAGLNNSTTYYWNVVAQNAGGAQQSTSTFDFVTVEAAPGAFELIAPANHAAGVPASGTMTWGAAPGAASYEVYYDVFTPPTTLRGTVLSPSYDYAGLSNAVGYYWAVRAVNAGGSVWSTSTFDFTVTQNVAAGWSQRASLPGGFTYKRIKDGGALTYAEEAGDGMGYVYAFKGNGRYDFFRYATTTGAWQVLESIPAFDPDGKKKGVKKGSFLVTGADGNIYAGKGNRTVFFWRYEPTTNAWVTGLPPVPSPDPRKTLKEGAGAAAVHTGGLDYIYLLKGSATNEFYRWQIGAGAWEQLAGAPLGDRGQTYKKGTILAYDGVDTIFVVKGGYNTMYAYSILGGTWTTQETLPFAKPGGMKKKVRDGAGMAYYGRQLYALKGGNTNEFWTYQCDLDRWQDLPDMPTMLKRVKGGGALVFAPNMTALYAFRGNNTFEFWSYGLATVYSPRNVPKGNVESNPGYQLSGFSLQIVPDPLAGNATISYTLPKPADVDIRLYDIAGSLVGIPAQGRVGAGCYSSAVSNHRLAAGVYLLKFETEGYQTTRKLILE